MQKDIGDDVHSGQLVTSFQSVDKSAAVDKTTSDFDNANIKVKKIRRLIKCGIYDADIAHFIPGTSELVLQGMIQKIKTIEQPVDTTYKDEETLTFELILDKNHYTILKKIHLCFPVRFRKLSKTTQDLDQKFMPVKKCFPHWIKGIDFTKYRTNKNLIPTTTQQEVYKYSDAMSKHLPKNALKIIQKIFCLVRRW